MWRKAGIVGCAVLFAVGILGFSYMRSQSFMTRAAVVLSEEIAGALNTEVRMETMRVDSLTAVSAGNVTLYDKAGKVLGFAPEVRVTFSPTGMLFGNSALDGIQTVEVLRPKLVLSQRANGDWNYRDLLSGEVPSSVTFGGKVRVKDAELLLSAQGKELTLNDLRGDFDFASFPAVSLDVSLLQDGASAKVTGTVGGSKDTLSVEAENIEIEPYLDYLPDNLPVMLQKGRVQSFKVTASEKSGTYAYSGEATVLGISMEAAGARVENLDGLVLFGDEKVRVFSRADVNAQPVVLKGTASLDLEEPLLDLQISSKGFEPRAVLPDFPLGGKVAFNAGISGTPERPIVTATVDVPETELYDYDLRNVHAEVRFSDRVLTVKSAEASLAGGKMRAEGQLDTTNMKYGFLVKADGPDASAFNAYVPGLEGAVRANVAVAGTGTDLDGVWVSGTAELSSGDYRGMSFERAAMGFCKDGDRIAVDYLTLQLPVGRMSAEGEISGGSLDLTLRGAGIDLTQLSSLQSGLHLSGIADVSGHISGTIASPIAEAEISAKNGEAFYQPFQSLHGKVQYNERQIALQRFILEDGKTRHEVDGSIRLAEGTPLDLKVISTKARAENIVRLLMPGTELTGNVDNIVHLTGPVDRLDADGEIHFSEGSYRKILLAKASGRYTRQAGKTVLHDFIVSSPNLNVKLSGELNTNGNLDFDIVADDIDLEKLNLKLPYPIAGEAQFIGKLQGTEAAPTFAGRLTAKKISLNDQELQDLDGTLFYKNDVINVQSFGFRQDGGQFGLSGILDLKTDRVRGKLSVQQGSLGAILSMFDLKNDWLDGRLDGTISISGTTKTPHIEMQGAMPTGHIKEYPLRDIVLNVELDDRMVTVREFKAAQGAGLLVVRGTADLQGPIALEIAGSEIDAGLITRLANYDLDTKGQLNFGAEVSGTVDRPKANLSLDIKGGGVGTATFDTLYGLFTLDNGIISVEQLLAQKGEYKASAYGIIPLAALGGREVSVKDQMNLKVSLDQADLSILPFLTRDVEWAMGHTKGGLTVSGTMVAPLIDGDISIADGAMKIKYFGKPIQNIKLDMQFVKDHIELRTFEGTMGNGSYHLTGSGRLTEHGICGYELSANFNQLQLDSAYYTGPLEGQLFLTEEIVRDAHTPKLKGDFLLENCTIDIPAIPASEEALPRILLDIGVRAGKKVRLYNSFLYDILLEGQVHFGGSTRRPQTSGELGATRGTVSYLKTPFKVQEASAYFNQVNSFLPSVNLEADTRLDRTKVYLKVGGPADQLQMKLTSDPEMNEASILSLLTLRSRYYDRGASQNGGVGRDELVSLLDIGLQMSFLSEVESTVRNATGLDEFRVVRDTLALGNKGESNLDREVYNIEIGKYVTEKLMLKYTKGVNYDSYKYGLQYDFSGRFSLTGEIDEQSNSMIGLEARFKF